MDSDQIFKLIDSVLPFEACLFHQILPLALEGSILKLGIVDPTDETALEYVRRILAYMNCSLVTQPISSEVQRSMLSAYLYHGGQSKAESPAPETSDAPDSDMAEVPAEEPDAEDKSDTTVPTVSPAPVESSVESVSEADSAEPAPPVTESPAPASSAPPDTPVLSAPVAALKSKIEKAQSRPVRSTTAIDLPPLSQPLSEVSILDIQAQHLYSPIEVLATLEPEQLLQELLGRVLLDGIGRLYFERQENHGRVLWSQDGVLQSVVEGLEIEAFQGLLNQLKSLAQMPLATLGEPKQVEIERLYKQTHLLLRLRIMPGEHGEGATLQVLRGAALRFYQQQQLANLGRDALRLAEQLQRKVNEIRDRTRLAPLPLDTLPLLDQLLKRVNQQVEDLIIQYSSSSPNPTPPPRH